ncbi:MAG TPA: glycosyltransferase family 1 protein [Phycisphaerae bacterium]|nr:glycosyltransferase family 1 protein [Phycisphaerae bacterium]
MTKGKTILCFASGYDAPPTSKHHVMHLLAKQNTVLWVNYHASRTPSASASDMMYMVKKLGQVAGGMRKVRKGLYVLTPLVLPLPGSKWAKRLNELLMVRQINAALMKIRSGGLEIWSFSPDIAYLVDQFKPEKVMYYCVDDFAHFTGYDTDQILRDEAQLAGMSDLVVTTSRSLMESKSHLNTNTILMPHGVDHEHFSSTLTKRHKRPADLEGIEGPVLGFFGLIRDWIDLDILAEVARARPGWNIVMLGDWAVDISGYEKLENYHFLGPKSYEDLPAYCASFDVGLIPFKINKLTEAVNPIKLREYLSAGLPVVSTALGEVVSYRDGSFAEIANTASEFITAVEKVLKYTPADKAKLSKAMASETWPAKVEMITQRMIEPFTNHAAKPLGNEWKGVQ